MPSAGAIGGILRGMRAFIGIAFLSLIFPSLAFLTTNPAVAAATAESISPVGVWKTFDDKTGKARAIVRIYEQDGKLFGRIEQSFTPGSEHRVCVPCTDERKNQPVIGLLIIRNIKRDGHDYSAETSWTQSPDPCIAAKCIWSRTALSSSFAAISGSRCWGVRKPGSGKADDAELSWLPHRLSSLPHRWSRNGVDPDGVGVGFAAARIFDDEGVPRGKLSTQGKLHVRFLRTGK